MDPLSITAGVIGGVSGLLTIYKETRKIYEKWRSKKKAKKTAEEELQNSLERAPDEVDCQRKSLSRIHGRRFDQGDEISHASLKMIADALNRKVLGVLKESLHIGHRGELEPESLWRVSNTARDDAIGTLMDLHRRLMVKAPIPRPLGERSSARNSNTSDSLRVSHPPPPRPEITATGRELVPYGQEVRSVVPFRATNASPIHSGSDSRPSSSLTLRSNYLNSDFQFEPSSSSSVSTRFRDSVSSSLAVPILNRSNGKTTADLLREWKDNINEKRASMLPSPTYPQSPVLSGPSRARQSQNMVRHSSAPSTPFFRERTLSPIHETSLPSPTSSLMASRPGLQYNREGMISGQRTRSDSYVPNVMSTPKMTSVRSPTINLESGFTHNLPSNSAKASIDEFFPSGS